MNSNNIEKNSGKKIAINGLFFAAYKLLNVLFPLITSVYVARVLLPAGTGKVAYAQNIVTYFTLIASLGLPTYGTREIARVIEKKQEYNKTFWELFIINALSTSLCVLCYYSLCFLLPSFFIDRHLHIVAGLSIVLNYFNIDWLYQGREEYKYISIRGIIIKILSVILLFILVKEAKDYVLYAGIHCFVLGGNNLINIIGLRKRVGLCNTKLELSKHIKPLVILFATNVAIELYTLLDTTMLGAMCEDEIVGYYSYAMKTTKIIVTVLAAITAVMLPKLSDYHAKGNRSAYLTLANKGLQFVLLTSIPCAVLLFSNADLIIQFLYGIEYMGAEKSMMILSVLIIPISLSTYLGTQVFCSSNLERRMLIAVTVGALSNILLNSILIRMYQHNGASVASVVSECVVAIIEIIFAKTIVGLKYDFRLIITASVGAGAIYLVIMVIRQLMNEGFITLVLSSSFGLLTYICVIFLLYRKIVLDLIHKK